ncbi:hypothetical protein MRX96_026886 [Rhipicephalus microplus]
MLQAVTRGWKERQTLHAFIVSERTLIVGAGYGHPVQQHNRESGAQLDMVQESEGLHPCFADKGCEATGISEREEK